MGDTDLIELPETAAPEPVGPLTETDLAALADAEETIAGGLQTYITVGMALGSIRDGMLYRDAYPSFEDYVRSKWGISRSYAYSLMLASGTVSAIADAGLAVPPNEAQARELSRLPEADRIDVWKLVLERTAGVPTAAAIRDVRAERVSAERRDVWDEATRRAGGEPPTAEIIQQVRADRAGTDSPPDRDPSVPSGAAAVATTGPAAEDLPGGVEEAPAGGATPAGAGPAPTDQVWIATARKGIEGHRVPSLTAQTTPCGRYLANGLTLPAAQAVEKHQSKWCPSCWPPAPPVVEAACGRCGTMTPIAGLVKVAAPADELRCRPCWTEPPAEYATMLRSYSDLLPGDYLEHWRGLDGSILGYDLVTRIEAKDPSRPTSPMVVTTDTRADPYERRGDTMVKVRRVPGRTKASGGVTGCAVCRAQVPVAVTYNDRCPSCVDDADRTAMMNAKLAAQAPGMVPGPEQGMPAARIRAGDVLQVDDDVWQLVTYVEISPAPEGPGEWAVHARTRKSTENAATVSRVYWWDDLRQVRRPIPGGAEPAMVTEPEPARAAVNEPAAVTPVDEPTTPPPVAEQPAPIQPARLPLTAAQRDRLRAAYRYARAHGWRHSEPEQMARTYPADESVPAPLNPAGHRAVQVDILWYPKVSEVEISYRSENYHMYDTVLRLLDVDQALDVLCALGLLPVEQSSAYLAGLAASSDGAR